MRKRILVVEDQEDPPCDLRVERSQLWVVKRHGDHLVRTTEVAHT